MFATGIMIKNKKVKKIEDGIRHVNKTYLQLGFKPHISMLIENLNRYVQKWLILEYPKIVRPRSNMYLRLNNSIGPSSNSYDLPKHSCISKNI